MSRIEDDEADRAERLRQERKLQEQQAQTKNRAEHEQFQSFVRKAGEASKQETHHDQQKQEANTDARNALMARRGIANNKDAEGLYAKNQAANSRIRANLKQRGEGKIKDNAPNPLLSGQHKSDTKATGFGVGRGGEKQSEQEGGREHKQTRRETGRGQSQPTNATFAAIGQAAVQALSGMGTKAGGANTVTSADQVKKMLEEIVRSVRQGVDQHGHELMEIELNDETLGGTRFTVLSTPEGVHLKVHTGEQGSRRSDRPIENLLASSATELSHAMTAAKVPLLGLEVNGEKVIA